MAARLTYDAHPKELAARWSGTTRISLVWSRRTHRAAVLVEDENSGETVELDVDDRENALDVYDHALAYAPQRGHLGRPQGPHLRAAT